MTPWRFVLQIKMPIFRIIVAVFLIAVDAIGILGNLAVVIIISSNRRFHVMRYFLLVSLAVCDFFLLVLVVPFRLASELDEDLAFSSTWCKANAFFTKGLYCSTTLHLIAVSYDRYLAVVKSPLTYNQHITKGKTMVMVCFVGIFPFVLPSIALFGIWEDHSSFNARLNFCDQGWDVQNEDQLSQSLASSVLAFVVPLLAIGWLNFKVFKTASRIEEEIMAEQAQISPQPNHTQPQMNRRKEHKAAKDVAVVLGVFVLCYLPAWITVFCRQVLPSHSVPAIVISITDGLLFSKSAWNPIIYAIRKREFRNAAKRMLRGRRVALGNY